MSVTVSKKQSAHIEKKR